MAYDRKTQTITVGKETDLFVDSGIVFVDDLKMDSEEKNAPLSIINDWKIIENWLGCAGRQLTKEDDEKIGKAWCAYLAVGVAPSDQLQPTFTSFSNKYRQEGLVHDADKPPKEVMDVFDRLLATDADIKKKRAHDIDSERKRFETILQNGRVDRGLRDRFESLSRNKRILIAITVAWVAWVVLRDGNKMTLIPAGENSSRLNNSRA